MEELTVIVAGLSETSDELFPSKNTLLPFLKALKIDGCFANYLKVDFQGRLTGILHGNEYVGPAEVPTITPEFYLWAERMRARWSPFQYIKTIIAQTKKDAPAQVSANERYLGDFTKTIRELGDELSDTVLLIDSTVSDRYRDRLDRDDVKYKLYTSIPNPLF